jgi:hypothetical protein
VGERYRGAFKQVGEVSLRDDVRRALVMQVIANEVQAAAKEARKPLEDAIGNADRTNVASPVDPEVPLGMAYRTQTTAKASVTDELAFLDWHEDNHPDRVDSEWVIDTDRMPEVIDALHLHAPNLLVEKHAVKDWAREEVLKATVKAREPVGPHGELDDLAPPVVYHPPKQGALTLKPSAEAADHIRELWAQGRIDLATGTIMELEASDEDR